MIKTPNLNLIIADLSHREALARGKQALGDLLGVTIPESWPTFPEAFGLPMDEETVRQTNAGWMGYLFLHPQDGVLVGNGGFVGEPDEDGTVEIGYEIASEYWNRGFATEAVRGFLDHAFSQPNVQKVIAHTLGSKNASNSVLQKVGMTYITELEDDDVGKIWQWGISKDSYHPV